LRNEEAFMSLQYKVVLLILTVFFVLAVLIYEAQSLFILPSYGLLEHEEAMKDMERGVNEFNALIKAVSTSIDDWSAWDDLDKYAQGENQEFQASNLIDSALKNLKINMLYIYNTSQKVMWGMMYNLETGKEIALPEVLNALQGSAIISQSNLDRKDEGFLMTSLGPMIIVAGSIRKSSGEGPVHGTLLFGQLIDKTAIAQKARINLDIIPIKQSMPDRDKASVISELGVTDKILIRSNGSSNIVYRVLKDVFGKPALLFQVTVPKTVTARGEMAVRFTMLSVLGAGALILIALILSLHFMMLKPLSLLTDHVLMVGRSKESLVPPLMLNRKDELGKLADEFNRTIERLGETRKALIDQSYHAGVAEMARGVLHNIGNAVTPVATKLSGIIESFRKAPATEMEMAAEELEKNAMAEDRREDMRKFMELAGLETAKLVKTATMKLQEVNKHVAHIQKILADQQRFSTAQRIIESIDLAEIIGETVGLLPERLAASVAIEPGPELRELPKVLSGRIALQQVISNLLINACESILERGLAPNEGMIGIHGAVESGEGLPMVHVRVTDNGIGIAPELQKKIFERDYSSKNRGSGLGLHWSANTISALKGRLYAESGGAGMGAVFHMLLPIASEIE
jgi:two-component system, NtrC family, sensor kinase